MNRDLKDDFQPISEWLRSERPPFSDEDYAAMRRGVWREIEVRREPEGALRPGRLVFAGGALLAAALVASLWLRPRTDPFDRVSMPGAASTPAAVAAAILPPIEEPTKPPTVRSARITRRRRPSSAGALAAAGEGVPVKIEFQTANPNVRIIWLVKKDEAAPRSPSAGPNEEVS